MLGLVLRMPLPSACGNLRKEALMTRTTKTIVTFMHPFQLDGDEIHPAGSYSIETDEEQLLEVSFPAFRRTATWMQRLNDQNPARVMPAMTVDPLRLAFALLKDTDLQEATTN